MTNLKSNKKERSSAQEQIKGIKNGIAVNPFLTDGALGGFIELVNLSEPQRVLLLSELPKMDMEERTMLFHTLKEIFLTELDGQQTLERAQKIWSE